MRPVSAYLRNVLLVGNPVSGVGRAGRYLDVAEEHFRRRGAAVEVVRTERAGDAMAAARGFSDGLIVAIGGDGTVNEVLNGADLDRCALSVMPAGTGNVLATELGLATRDPERWTHLIEAGRPVRMDLGVCNGRRFACMFGAGLDAHVVDLVHRSRARRLTLLHFVPTLVRVMLRMPQWGIRVTLDGRPFVTRSDLVCVGNTRTYGGPFSPASAASPVDAVLDAMAARFEIFPDYLLPCLATFLHSTHACPLVRYARGRRVRVTSSRPDVPYQIDGDPAGHLPADIRIEPARLCVIAAPAFAGGAPR